jgi:glycosyltransferase involved in cell wall biosynthesis
MSIYESYGFDSAKMRVCYNMVDPSAYRQLNRNYLFDRFNIPKERRVLLFAGRFAPYKGANDIIRAIPTILERSRPVHFVFVGQGSMLTALTSQVEALDVGDYVTFGGFVPPEDMPHAYASAYVYLHPATWPEPFARGPIEALAAGTAVVGTATGGTPEVIADESTGILIPPFDSDSLATACIRLLEDIGMRNEVASQGQELVLRKFSMSGQIRAYVSAYEQAL